MRVLISVVGPTASGKTALAVQLAQAFNTAVISADSRQCYRELSIGTAKPTPEEMQGIPHYFINSHSIEEEVSAGLFEKLALQYAGEIFAQHNVAVLCGGTGLYVKAFCEGIDEMPPIPPDVRRQLNTQYQQEGLPWLQQQVQQQDPGFYAIAETQNPMRLLRALEVRIGTGQSIASFRGQNTVQHPFHIVRIGLELPREVLYARIDQRMDIMIATGLFQEAEALYPYRHHQALQTVGSQEIFDFMDGHYDKEEAIRLLKRNSRRYAKRQLTWFKRDAAMRWFAPADIMGMLAYID